MLLYVLTAFADAYPPLNVFRYITFRTGGAIATALLVALWFGPVIIARLKRLQGKGQPIRLDGPAGHLSKAGTPTMGGVLILIALAVSVLLWADLANPYVWVVLFATLGFGAIGFWDDYLKVSKTNPKGAPGRARLGIGVAISVVVALAYWALSPEALANRLAMPFLKDVLFDLSWAFVPFTVLVIVGSANAVNLTDGLDGLAIFPVMVAGTSFGLIAYLVGNSVFSGYLQIHYVPGVGELSVFAGALLGAGLGFLWWNAPPAMVFMGDTGALAMGAALGAIAVAAKHEIVLAVIGGLFVVEAVSVMAQVASFKLTGKRIFRMAPLHHHFEQKGWAEPTIVIRFWIVAVILALVGLSTLKLR